MEMRVTEYQLPAAIEFNFEELKAELTAKVAHYENLVYTDDQITEAKADRASLNKLKKALNDERIRREKEYMQPFNEFKAKVNEIIGIIDKPVGIIDRQIKEAEEQKKQAKLDSITSYFNTTEHPDWLHLSQIMNEKWMNASTSMKSVQEEMNAKLDQIELDLTTLHDLPEFGFEATEVYRTSLDMNRAINEAKRMSDIAKAKAAAEEQARLKAEAEAKAAEAEPEVNNVPDINVGHKEPAKQPEAPKQWVAFQAYLSVEQAKALGQYLKAAGIEYKAV